MVAEEDKGEVRSEREVEAKNLSRSFSLKSSSSWMGACAERRALVLIFGYLAEGVRCGDDTDCLRGGGESEEAIFCVRVYVCVWDECRGSRKKESMKGGRKEEGER